MGKRGIRMIWSRHAAMFSIGLSGEQGNTVSPARLAGLHLDSGHNERSTTDSRLRFADAVGSIGSPFGTEGWL